MKNKIKIKSLFIKKIIIMQIIINEQFLPRFKYLNRGGNIYTPVQIYPPQFNISTPVQIFQPRCKYFKKGVNM